MARIVIIGAGLTGLSVAYHLEKLGCTDFRIFEQEDQPGGLCRSLHIHGFTFDFTGHLIHINDPYFQTFIEDTITFKALTAITRQSFVYSHNTLTRYPFQQNLYGLPTKVIADCIRGYMYRKKNIHKPATFPEWVYKYFGSGFARHFFLPFQKKLFDCNLNTVTASWTGRFVPQTSLEEILEGTIHENTNASVGYNAQFFYPTHGGIMSWINTIVNKLHTPIAYDHSVKLIDMNSRIIYFQNGHTEPYDTLVTTIPLNNFIKIVQEKSTTHLKSALSHLQCNAITSFQLGIAHSPLTDAHWIYFPESKYPFYRLGFPHNFSTFTTPAQCSSVYGEIAHFNRSSQWINKQIKKARASTNKFLDINDSDIITQNILTIPHAYVLYTHWREKNLPLLHAQLAKEKIFSIGRYGAWKYASMQEAILDGQHMAQQLIDQPITTHYVYHTSISSKTYQEKG